MNCLNQGLQLSFVLFLVLLLLTLAAAAATALRRDISFLGRPVVGLHSRLFCNLLDRRRRNS